MRRPVSEPQALRRIPGRSVAQPHRLEQGVGVELARYYDLDVADERSDVAMYLALASASDGPILELACGSGRICVPLAAAGQRVTGVDRDTDMLGRAADAWRVQPRAKGSAGSLELIEADMSRLALAERYDLVILGFNGLLLMPNREAQESLLHRMSEHLAADGRAVIDIWLPTPEDLALYDGRMILEWVRRDEETGENVSKTTAARYEHATARATIETFFDAWLPTESPRRSYRRDEIRFTSATELLALVESVGLRPQMVAGDYSMSELTPDSERLIVVAAGPGAGRRPRRSNRLSLL